MSDVTDERIEEIRRMFAGSHSGYEVGELLFYIDQQRAEIAELEAKLAEAERKAAALDWLEQIIQEEQLVLSCYDVDEDEGCVFTPWIRGTIRRKVEAAEKTLLEAIEALRIEVE